MPVAAKPHGKDRPRTELRFRALHGLASALAAASRGGRKAQVKVLKAYGEANRKARGTDTLVDIIWALVNSPEFLYRH